MRADPITGDAATIFDAPCSWVMIDLDNIECPKGLLGEDRVRHAIKTLPEELQKTTCVYQFSSSEGVYGWSVVKVHLWYWLAEPLNSRQALDWFSANCAHVDLSVFNPVQLHFTASPIFDGVSDPVEQRVGIIVGTQDAARLEKIPQKTQPNPVTMFKKVEASKPKKMSEFIAATRDQTLLTLGLFADIANAIWANNRIGSRHKAIVSAAMRLSGYSKAHLVDWQEAMEFINVIAMELLADARGHQAAQEEIADILTYAENHAHPTHLSEIEKQVLIRRAKDTGEA